MGNPAGINAFIETRYCYTVDLLIETMYVANN